VSVTTPGSTHEGGELGYVLVHAFGAAFDNPDLIVAAVVGDGEAETGPLAGSWQGISFLNPARDGALLPILHLNGHKISGPTVLGRSTDGEIRDLLTGHGYDVVFVEGDEPESVHRQLAIALETCYASIPRDPARRARQGRLRAPALARPRAADAEGMDRSQDRGRPSRGGNVPGASGAVEPGQDESRAPPDARAVDAELPFRGAVSSRWARV
jgi:xylulose-5-phosphate/fructose-6-phosphate phosphoketolase